MRDREQYPRMSRLDRVNSLLNFRRRDIAATCPKAEGDRTAMDKRAAVKNRLCAFIVEIFLFGLAQRFRWKAEISWRASECGIRRIGTFGDILRMMVTSNADEPKRGLQIAFLVVEKSRLRSSWAYREPPDATIAFLAFGRRLSVPHSPRKRKVRPATTSRLIQAFS